MGNWIKRLNWSGWGFTMLIVILGATANKSVNNVFHWLILVGIGFILSLFPLIAGIKDKQP